MLNYFYFCIVTDLPVAESRLSSLNPPNTFEIPRMCTQNIYFLVLLIKSSLPLLYPFADSYAQLTETCGFCVFTCMQPCYTNRTAFFKEEES